MIGMQSPELNNLSQASIFALPKFDAEKEMRMLQNLWTKRCSVGDSPPLICRSPQPSQDFTEIIDSSERSFFENDSDSEDDEVSNKRYVPQSTRIIVVNHGNVDEEVAVDHFLLSDEH